MRNYIKIFLKRIDFFTNFFLYVSDYQYMRKYSLSNSQKSQDKYLASIMLHMHALEKGMSFPTKRIFGENKAINLTKLLSDYLQIYPYNNTCKIAINVLYEYLKSDYSTRNTKSRETINNFLLRNKEILQDNFSGTKEVSNPPLFDRKLIEAFFESRSSVRFFSDAEITEEEVIEVMKIASTTPTACNRQTSRVHIYKNKETISQLIDNQLGDQGWCNNANALFVITSNVSYFNNSYERFQPFIDGGLFAMNFDMGLHLNHIASCFKMFVREPKREKKFKEIAQIPKNEVPIVLILAGHYKEHIIESPKSVKLGNINPREHLTFHA